MKTKTRKPKNRLLNVLGGIACGVSSLFYAGCQAPQMSYLDNPKGVSGLTVELGKTANYFDAKVTGTRRESLKNLGENLGAVPKDIAGVVDSVTSVAGLRPFNGKFFGMRAYNGVDYGAEFYTGGSAKLLEGAVVYVPCRVAEILDAQGKLTRGVFNIAKELANMVAIQPLTYNTKAKKQLLKTGKLPETTLPGDRARLTADTVTDVVKAPLRTVLAVSDSRVVPPTTEYLWNGVKTWGGINVTNKKAERLKLKLTNPQTGKAEGGRMFVNAIPVLGLVLDGFNGTTLERTGNGFRKIAEPIKESIPAPGLNDNDWYPCPGLESRMPGVIRDGRLYPTESWITRFFGALRSGVSLYGSGGGGGASFGGGRIGGSGGGGRGGSGGGR